MRFKVYVDLEGQLDFNSPPITIEDGEPTQVIIPEAFGDMFPNPDGIEFEPITITWGAPAPQTTRNYDVGITTLDDAGYESSMAMTTRTLIAQPEPPAIDDVVATP